MTVIDAQKVCSSMTECMGFTLATGGAGQAISLSSSVTVYLKASDEWVAHDSHVTYIKARPNCQDVKMMRYKRAGHGPYCCEGKKCPEEHAYATMEQSCSLPGSTPFGAPNCASLRGEPLQNLALTAKASALSQWGYAEDAGIDAPKDGIIDGNHFFHSQCERGPQWFRLAFSAPAMIYQVALHNRPTLKARLVGARLRLVAANGTALAVIPVTSARSMYLWTLRPFVVGATMVEISLPTEEGCLHFVELEAFGMPQTLFESGEATFTQDRPQPVRVAITSDGSANQVPSSAGAAHGISRAAGGDGREVHLRAAAGGEHEDEDEDEDANRERAGAPPHGSRQRARRAAWEDEAAARETLASADEGQAMWMATTTFSTTLVIVLLQFLWVKAHWIDVWH